MSNASWWANKLQQAQPQAPQRQQNINLPSLAPSQQPMAPMPQFQQQPVSKAQSASQTQLCPECGSTNFMSVNNTAPRCFDCGYPIEQSGSRYGSLAGAHVEGNTKGSRGNNAVNDWNPQGVIGRVAQ